MRFPLVVGALVLMILAACGPNATPTTVATLAPRPTATAAPPTAPPATSAPVVTATPEPGGGVTITPPTTAEAVATSEALGATPVPAPPVEANSKLVGTYSGILPAADAPGRIVTLELALGGTATMTTQFIGRGGPSIETGTWTSEGDRAMVILTLANGKPEDNRITWTLEGTKLASTEFDPASYGTAGLPLTRVGTGDIREATFSGVSFSYDAALAQSAQGAVLGARPVEVAPGLGGGAPQGVRFLFDEEVVPDYLDPQRPQLYIYPVAGMSGLDPSIAAGIKSLQELLASKPVTPTADIFVFPLIPSVQVMRTQVHYLDFINGKGVRFVTYYSQDASPITNDRVFYTFQGLTLDGQYYISASWPVKTPAIADENAPAPDLSTAEKFDAYLNEVVSTVNSLPPAGFVPNLTLLDNLVQSIHAAPEVPTRTAQGTPEATTSAPEGTPPANATAIAPPTAPPQATTTPLANATEVPQATVGAVGQLVTATFEGANIRFSRTLAQTAQGVQIPAVPVDPNSPMLGGGAPGHLAFAFNGETITADVNPFQGAVRVYPLDALKALDPAVARELLALKTMLAARPATIPEAVPVFPLFNAQQVIHPQIKYLQFAGGEGVRMVTYYAQNVGPVTNSGLFYTFQGLSSDGKYFVSVFWPLRTDRLPNTYQDANIPNADAFAEHYEQYIADIDTMLNQLPPNGFTPDLILLDQLSQSVQLPKP